MARIFNGKRPENLRQTVRDLLRYLGQHRILLLLVGILAAVSASANLLGTYMIKPIVNRILEGGGMEGLLRGVALAALIYGIGALSTLGYTQIMVRAAQEILRDIRRDLLARLQKLPLSFFDSQKKGDLMSMFTNDVDTVSDALNNSFATIIQSFIQVAGTLCLLFVLNYRLSFLVFLGYGVMFLYIRYSTNRSKFYFRRQQEALGEFEVVVVGAAVDRYGQHQGYLERLGAAQGAEGDFGKFPQRNRVVGHDLE